jgi:hypothetical protein
MVVLAVVDKSWHIPQPATVVPEDSTQKNEEQKENEITGQSLRGM